MNKKDKIKDWAKKNKKKLIFAGITAGAIGGYFGYAAIRAYGANQYTAGVEKASKAAYDISYEKLREDVLDGYLNHLLLETGNGGKVTIHNKKLNKNLFVVGDNQKLDFVNSCIDNVPEIKAHMMARFGNPAAEVRTF